MKEFVLTEEQRALASSCFLLACKLASKYAHALGGLEEAQSVAWVALCRAAHYYDPARLSPKTGQPVKFVTLAGMSVTRALRSEVRNRARRYSMRSRRKSLVIPWADLAEHYPDGDERQFDPPAPPPPEEPDPLPPVTELLPALGEREYMVVRRVVMQGETNASVARDMGLSRARVRQILHNGLTTLRQLAVLRGMAPQNLVKPVMCRRSNAPISCLEASYLLGARLPLTERARQVLTRIAAGTTVTQVARELGVTRAAVYEMLARTRRLLATLEQEAPHAAS